MGAVSQRSAAARNAVRGRSLEKRIEFDRGMIQQVPEGDSLIAEVGSAGCPGDRLCVKTWMGTAEILTLQLNERESGAQRCHTRCAEMPHAAVAPVHGLPRK